MEQYWEGLRRAQLLEAQMVASLRKASARKRKLSTAMKSPHRGDALCCLWKYTILGDGAVASSGLPCSERTSDLASCTQDQKPAPPRRLWRNQTARVRIAHPHQLCRSPKSLATSTFCAWSLHSSVCKISAAPAASARTG